MKLHPMSTAPRDGKASKPNSDWKDCVHPACRKWGCCSEALYGRECIGMKLADRVPDGWLPVDLKESRDV